MTRPETISGAHRILAVVAVFPENPQFADNSEGNLYILSDMPGFCGSTYC
jgi:hypothetical protein